MALTIRAARSDDFDTYLRLLVELGVDDPAPSPEVWARRLLPSLQIAEQDGRIAGFVLCELLQDTGYVRQLVTAPTARRAGVGRTLMLAAAARLRAAGLERWRLNVKPENAAAIALYRSLGLAFKHESVALRLHWSDVEGLPHGQDPVEELLPERDAEIEVSLGWPAALLSSSRRRNAASVIFHATSEGELRGLAAFDPVFGGAYPFFATAPDVAASLLRAVHARRADNGRDYVQLLVEKDPGLARAILDWGGWVALRVDLYTGPVPGS
jgi:GNAT superfamily N-acetyltransferase